MDSERCMEKKETKEGNFDMTLGDKTIFLEAKYNQLITDVSNKKERLSYLRNKEQTLPYFNHKKIKVISWIIALFTFLFLIVLSGYFLEQIIFSFLLTDLQTFLVSCISIFVGFPILGSIDIIVFKKIVKVMQQKSYNNIINSLKYKQLLEEINDVSKSLDEKLAKQTEIEKELFGCRTKQAILDAEKSIRFVLGNYNNEVEDETLVTGSRIRGYSRKLVNNDRNFNRRNIE